MLWRGEVATWAAILFACSLALPICLARNQIAASISVFDAPDGVQKRHNGPVPLVGGLAILLPLASCICATLLLGTASHSRLQLALLLCSIGAGLVGLADDQHDIGVLTRIALLAVIGVVGLSIGPHVIPDELHWGVLGATPIWPVAFGALFVVASVGIVNAVNMADGADGIVGSMYLVWSVCLLIAGTAATRYAALAIAGSTIVFLGFNLRSKLFLGGCGSYGVTFAIGFLVAVAHAAGRVSLETVTVWFALPVLDCLRLMVLRIRRGRSPFSRDRQHLHHVLEIRAGRFGRIIYIAAVASSSLLATIDPGLSLACLILLVMGFVAATWPLFNIAKIASAMEVTVTVAAPVRGETRAQRL